MFLPHLPPLSSIAGNQFTTGGIMLMLLTAFMTFIKGLPGKITGWFMRQFTVTITIVDNDASFTMAKEWVATLPFTRRSRRVDLAYKSKVDGIQLRMAPGTHVFWYKYRPVWFYFTRTDKQNSKERTESFSFRTIGRRQEFIRGMVKHIEAEYWSKQVTRTELYLWDRDCWKRMGHYTPRTLDTVEMAPGAKEGILAVIDKFLASEDRYKELGIPYHFGIELDGPPGTGKSSLASALGQYYKKSVYMLSIVDMGSDGMLRAAMQNVEKNSIVLFEDIDAAGVGAKREGLDQLDNVNASPEDIQKAFASKGVTLSGLLNVLDGLTAPTKVIYLMTTNHHDNLDPALLRPGRIDYRVTMSYACVEQKVHMIRRFFPGCSADFVLRALYGQPEKQTMAEFQNHLLTLMATAGIAQTGPVDGELEDAVPIEWDQEGPIAFSDGDRFNRAARLYPEHASVAVPSDHGTEKVYTRKLQKDVPTGENAAGYEVEGGWDNKNGYGGWNEDPEQAVDNSPFVPEEEYSTQISEVA